MEIGPQGASGSPTATPHLDFHTVGGTGNDYDMRLQAMGGTIGTIGTGWLRVSGSKLQLFDPTAALSLIPLMASNGNPVNLGLNTGVLATTATTGFPVLPTMAGAPTGMTGAAGAAPIVIDSTDNKLCWNSGGGVKCVTGS